MQLSKLSPESREKELEEQKQKQANKQAAKKKKIDSEVVAERELEDLRLLHRIQATLEYQATQKEREESIEDYRHHLKKSEDEAREQTTGKQTSELAPTHLVFGDTQHAEKHANDPTFLFAEATALQIKLIKQIFDIYADANPAEKEDFKADITPDGTRMQLKFGEPTNNHSLKQKQHEHVINFATLLFNIQNNLFHLIPQGRNGGYDHSRLANYRGMSLIAQNTMNNHSQNYCPRTPWDGIIYGPARTRF